MNEEPKGTMLVDIDKELSLRGGTPVSVLSSEKSVNLTRKIAIVQALEAHSATQKGDKFKAFDLGMRFESANGKISITAEESVMVKSAIEKAWPQPGLYVPLCRWLEGA